MEDRDGRIKKGREEIDSTIRVRDLLRKKVNYSWDLNSELVLECLLFRCPLYISFLLAISQRIISARRVNCDSRAW